MKYVLVNDENDNGGVFCLGIFDNKDEAIGVAMRHIWDLHDSYRDHNDYFEYTEPYMMDGDGGLCICVKYKAACWDHMEKPCEEYYYILFCEEDSDE